jgi:hypothetical protein
MDATEFVNIQQALLAIYGPILTVIYSLILSGGLLIGVLALVIELVTHRRRKTPQF